MICPIIARRYSMRGTHVGNHHLDDGIIINPQSFAIIFLPLPVKFLAHSSLCALHIPLRLSNKQD